MMNTRQLMLAMAGGVISTTAKTHIQLKNEDMAEPRARIRVVVICEGKFGFEHAFPK